MSRILSPVMDILRFRVVLDSDEQVFRDIELPANESYEMLHLAVVSAFGMEEGQMSSFYVSNSDWDKGREIPLVDMGTSEEPMKSMSEMRFEETKIAEGYRLLYVFDFLNLKIFFIELVSIFDQEENVVYPKVSLIYGDDPVFKDDMEFEMFTEGDASKEKEDNYDPYGDDLYNESFEDDQFGSHDNIDDLEGLI